MFTTLRQAETLTFSDYTSPTNHVGLRECYRRRNLPLFTNQKIPATFIQFAQSITQATRVGPDVPIRPAFHYMLSRYLVDYSVLPSESSGRAPPKGYV